MKTKTVNVPTPGTAIYRPQKKTKKKMPLYVCTYVPWSNFVSLARMTVVGRSGHCNIPGPVTEPLGWSFNETTNQPVRRRKVMTFFGCGKSAEKRKSPGFWVQRNSEEIYFGSSSWASPARPAPQSQSDFRVICVFVFQIN